MILTGIQINIETLLIKEKYFCSFLPASKILHPSRILFFVNTDQFIYGLILSKNGLFHNRYFYFNEKMSNKKIRRQFSVLSSNLLKRDLQIYIILEVQLIQNFESSFKNSIKMTILPHNIISKVNLILFIICQTNFVTIIILCFGCIFYLLYDTNRIS